MSATSRIVSAFLNCVQRSDVLFTSTMMAFIAASHVAGYYMGHVSRTGEVAHLQQRLQVEEQFSQCVRSEVSRLAQRNKELSVRLFQETDAMDVTSR